MTIIAAELCLESSSLKRRLVFKASKALVLCILKPVRGPACEAPPTSYLRRE